MKYLQDLVANGYCIIKGVYSFNSGCDDGDVLKEGILDWIKKAKVPYTTHGVVKHHQVGQQPFQWQTRCRKEVQEPFKKIFKTDRLVCSFDGIGYVPAEGKRRDSFWMHTDQAPNSSGFKSVQGIVALTSNSINTFKCLPGSHLLHGKYFASKGVSDKSKLGKNWHRLESDTDFEIHTGVAIEPKSVPLEAGDLLIFDSRLFHQNAQGGNEERLVQYVTFLPKEGRDLKQKEKRVKYFNDRRTTSHWPYPLNVNGTQPQTYGNLAKVIDYTALPEIDFGRHERFGNLDMNAILDLI
jgi:hypothetical protein